MRLKTSNLFEDLLGRALYSFFYTLLIFPWVFLIIQLLSQEEYNPETIWIYGLAMFLSGIILQISEKINNSFLSRLAALLFLVIANILCTLLTNSLRVPIDLTSMSTFELSLVMMVVFQMIGLRFNKLFSGEMDFNVDYSRGAIFMLFTLFVKARIGLYIPINQVLLFFLSGAILSILFKYMSVKENNGSQTSWIGVALSVVLFISIFAILLTYGLTTETIAIVIAPILFLGNLLTNIFLELLLFGLVMLEPILTWLKGILPPFVLPEQEGMENSLAEQLQDRTARNTAKFTDNSSIYGLIVRVVIVVGVLLIVWYFLKRYWKSRKRELGYEELRESIFETTDLKQDIRRLLESLKNRFRRKKSDRSIYDDSSIAIRIRKIYYQFLRFFYEISPFETHYTPEEYKEKINRLYPDQTVTLEQITHSYEQARYGSEVSREELEQIQHAYEKMVTVAKNKPDEGQSD